MLPEKTCFAFIWMRLEKPACFISTHKAACGAVRRFVSGRSEEKNHAGLSTFLTEVLWLVVKELLPLNLCCLVSLM
jgi:hypothetical protein